MPPKAASTKADAGACPQCGGPLGPASPYAQASGECLRCGYAVTDDKAEAKERPSGPKA